MSSQGERSGQSGLLRRVLTPIVAVLGQMELVDHNQEEVTAMGVDRLGEGLYRDGE